MISLAVPSASLLRLQTSSPVSVRAPIKAGLGPGCALVLAGMIEGTGYTPVLISCWFMDLLRRVNVREGYAGDQEISVR
jgi:hypothetical protein